MIFISEIGQLGLFFWLPLCIWTIGVLPCYFALKRFGPMIRYHGAMALLMSLPAGFLLMPLFIASNASLPVSISLPISVQSPVEISMPEIEPLTSTEMSEADAVSSIMMTDTERIRSTPLPEAFFDWLILVGLLTIFIGGHSLFKMTELAYQITSFRKMKTHFIPVRDRTALDKLEALKAKLGVKKSVRLLSIPSSASPMMYGCFHPVIAVPESLLKDHASLSMVLIHELIHVRRNDYPLVWCVRISTALLGFHPVVALLGREVRLYGEISCDAELLGQSHVSSSDYARLLLQFSTILNKAPAIAMVHQSSTLKQRINAMKAHIENNSLYSWPVRLMIMALLLFMPAMLVACSSGAESEQAESGIERVNELQAQVAYLRAEIETTSTLIVELNNKISSEEYSTEKEYDTMNKERSFQANRSNLLNEMLWKQVQALEIARMELATPGWIGRVENE